jgi:hypothetical protein
MPVFDRSGVDVGRVLSIHRGDPLAVSDDGRRISDSDDFSTMIPGWSVGRGPRVPAAAAAGLVRVGYLKIVSGRSPRRTRYAALTDIGEVDADEIRLQVAVDALPIEA